MFIKSASFAFRAASILALSSGGFAFGQSAASSAKTYYVSPGGNDGNDGLSQSTPWQTVAKVDQSSFNPGDTILFQRGGQWHESLIVPSSGAQSNPITFADYGNGAKPKFWGSVVLDNAHFVPQANGIYTYASAAPIYSVLVNHGFLNYSFGQPASQVANSWFYENGQLAINSPASDPRYDGRVYTGVLRDDVVYSNYQSHLVFRNLVVDESARYDDNGGYGFRVMGSQDVQVADCEAYHAGKHHFGVINSTQFVGTNLVAAYAAPGQNASGGASAFVTYGDGSTGLYSQTSEWHNVSASSMDDPQEQSTYYAFISHGSTVTSLWLDHIQSSGANVSFTNEDNTAATEKITGGLIQNARLELGGNGVLVDGLELSGPYASVDMTGNNTVLQNLLMHGTSMGYAWYQTAILSRGYNNILRFSTIEMGANAGSNTAIATTNVNGGLQFYGNVLLAPQRVFALWDLNLNSNTVSNAAYNFYLPGSTFAGWVGSAFNWNDEAISQWKSSGFDAGSLTGSPQFVDDVGGNFRPATGSPLIDASHLPASLLSSVPLDFVGNPRLQGSAFDMGAFESTSAPAIAQPVMTSTTLSLSNNTLNAQITAASGVPSGSVSFYDGSALLGTAALNSGGAYLAVSLSTSDAHVLTATYGGDLYDQASTSNPVNVDPVVAQPSPTPPPEPTPTPTPVPTPVPQPVPAPIPTPAAPQVYPITLTSPTDGQTVSGGIVVTAVIAQTLDAAGSQLWVDGHPLNDHRTTQAPYAYGLDTTQLTSGLHTLQIWAHDIGNNNLLSNMVTVNVEQ